MTEPKTPTMFDTLSQIDLTKFHKKKGSITYLPWSVAWAETKKRFPTAHCEIVKTPDGCIYHTDGKTCWVETSITIDGETQNETLAVMDNRNASIAADAVTSTAVGKAIKRCMVKNLALFGLDLNLWNGEELSDAAKEKKDADEKKNAAELADIKKEIIRVCTEMKESGADINAIYKIIEEISGAKNPNFIKDVTVAKEVLDAVTNIH